MADPHPEGESMPPHVIGPACRHFDKHIDYSDSRLSDDELCEHFATLQWQERREAEPGAGAARSEATSASSAACHDGQPPCRMPWQNSSGMLGWNAKENRYYDNTITKRTRKLGRSDRA